MSTEQTIGFTPPCTVMKQKADTETPKLLQVLKVAAPSTETSAAIAT